MVCLLHIVEIEIDFETLIVLSFKKYRLYNVKQSLYPVKEKKENIL